MASASDIRAGGAFVELYLKGGHLVEQGLDKIAHKTRAFAMSLSTVASISNMAYGHSATAIRTSLTTMSNMIDKTAKGIQTAVRETAKVITATLDAIPKAISKTGKALESIGTQGLFTGLLAGGAGFQTMSTFMEYERQMARVKALTGATGAMFAEMTETVRELGRTTQYTTAQVAEGMAYLAMAGLKAQDAIDVLPHVLDLATAAQMDLGITADIVTDIGLAFGYTGKETKRVTDVIAQAATNSNTTVEKMGMSFKYLASFAVSAGQSIEDMASAVALLAQVGIKGNTAGTGLREALINMVTPAKRRKLQDVLGINVANARGEMRPLFDIIEDLKRSLSRLPQVTQLEHMSQIFGKRGGNVMLSLTHQPTESLRNMQQLIYNSEGATERMAAIMRDSLWGSWKAFVSVIQDIQIEIGTALVPAIRGFLDAMTRGLRVFNEWLSKNHDWVVSVSLVIPALIAAGGATLVFGKALTTIATIVTPVFTAVSAGISGMSMAIIGLTGLSGVLSTALLLVASAVQTVASGMQSAMAMVSIMAISMAGMTIAFAQVVKLPILLVEGVKLAIRVFNDMASVASKMFATTAESIVKASANVVTNAVELTGTVVTEFTKAGAEFTSTIAGLGAATVSSARTVSHLVESMSNIPVVMADITRLGAETVTTITGIAGSATNAVQTITNVAETTFETMSSVSKAIGNIGVALASTTETVAGFVNSTSHAFQAVTRFANGAVTSATIMHDFAASFVNVADTATKTTSTFSRLVDTLMKVKSTIVGVTSSLTELVVENLKAVGTAMLTIFTAVLKVGVSLGTALLPLIAMGTIMYAMWAFLKAVIVGLVVAVQQLAVAFANMAISVASALGTALLGSLNAVGAAFGRLFTGMQKYFRDNKKDIDAWKNSLLGAFDEVKKTFRIVVQLLQAGEISAAMRLALAEALYQLGNLEMFAKGFLKYLAGVLPVALKALGDVFKEMFSGIGQYFTDLWEHIKQEFRIIMAELKFIVLDFLGIVKESGVIGLAFKKAGEVALNKLMAGLAGMEIGGVNSKEPAALNARFKADQIRDDVNEERTIARLAPEDREIVTQAVKDFRTLKLGRKGNEKTFDEAKERIDQQSRLFRTSELIDLAKLLVDKRSKVGLPFNKDNNIKQFLDMLAPQQQGFLSKFQNIIEGSFKTFVDVVDKLDPTVADLTKAIAKNWFGFNWEKMVEELKDLREVRGSLLNVDTESSDHSGKTKIQAQAEKRLKEIDAELKDLYNWGVAGEWKEQLEKEKKEQEQIIRSEKAGRGIGEFGQPIVRSAKEYEGQYHAMAKRAGDDPLKQKELESAGRLAELAKRYHYTREGKFIDLVDPNTWHTETAKEQQKEFDELRTQAYINRGLSEKDAKRMVETENRNTQAEYLRQDIVERKEKIGLQKDERKALKGDENFDNRGNITKQIREIENSISRDEKELKKLGGDPNSLSRHYMNQAMMNRIFDTTTKFSTFSAYDVIRGGGNRKDDVFSELQKQTEYLQFLPKIEEGVNQGMGD